MVEQGAEAVEPGPQSEITDAAERANRVDDEFERDLDAYLADSAHGLPRRLAHLAEPRNACAHDRDALVHPSITEPPPAIGTAQPSRNCRLAGHSGFPASSLPAEFTGAGLPVGGRATGPALQ